jgi:putative phage repressor
MNEKEEKISPVKQRILHFVNTLDISKRAFYDKIGVSRGTLESKSGATEDVVAKFIAAYPIVNINWLITGNGQMTNTQQSKGLYSANDSMALKSTPTTEGIPIIPFSAMAGYLSGEMSINEDECERLYVPGLKADFVIKISGNSMEPLYFNGDYVACEKASLSDVFFQWGKVYVVDTKDGVAIKRIGRGSEKNEILLISENKDYIPIPMPVSAIHHIALVKGVIRIE